MTDTDPVFVSIAEKYATRQWIPYLITNKHVLEVAIELG